MISTHMDGLNTHFFMDHGFFFEDVVGSHMGLHIQSVGSSRWIGSICWSDLG